MQKDANLVELEKYCQTYIRLQNFVFDTAENEPAKNLQNLPNEFANFGIILLTLTLAFRRASASQRVQASSASWTSASAWARKKEPGRKKSKG